MHRWWSFLILAFMTGHFIWTGEASPTASFSRLATPYGITTRESLGSGDVPTPLSFPSTTGFVSEDGRWITFASDAPTLVPGDTNDVGDVFLRDRVQAQTLRISLGFDGMQANGISYPLDIAADGQVVLFWSEASNLVPSDFNNAPDLFVWNRATNAVTCVTVELDGDPGYGSSDEGLWGRLSADGRYVAFSSKKYNLVPTDAYYNSDAFVHDLETGETVILSVGFDATLSNSDSYHVDISADGRYVTFASVASNLVAGDTNGAADIFLHDRDSGETTRISHLLDGGEVPGPTYRPALSGNGQIVAFGTYYDLDTGQPTSSYSLYHYDRPSQTLRLAVRQTPSPDTYPPPSLDIPLLSHDGNLLFFMSTDATLVAQDTNQVKDVYEWNATTDRVTRLSLSSFDDQGSSASQLHDVSNNGKWVMWSSASAELVDGDTNAAEDVFLREQRDSPAPPRTPTPTATPRVAPYGYEQFLPLAARFAPHRFNLTGRGNGRSYAPVLSADGAVVAFVSEASTLVAGDTNGAADIFVWERATATITRVSVAADGTQLAGNSAKPSISNDGRYVVYTAYADGVVPDDINGKADIVRYDRLTGEVLLVSRGINGHPGDDDSLRADVAGNGQVVIFSSKARNLTTDTLNAIPIGRTLGFVRQMDSGQTTLLRGYQGGVLQFAGWPSISDDGTRVSLSAGTPSGNPDTPIDPCPTQSIYHLHLETGEATTVARYEDYIRYGSQPVAPRIAPDGLRVGYFFLSWYSSTEGSGVSHSLRVTPVGTTGGLSLNPYPVESCEFGPLNSNRFTTTPISSFSLDGAQVAMAVYSTDIYIPYAQILLFDQTTGQTVWVSAPLMGQSNAHSYDPVISDDGRVVVFASDADNLESADSNGVTDIFLWYRE